MILKKKTAFSLKCSGTLSGWKISAAFLYELFITASSASGEISNIS